MARSIRNKKKKKISYEDKEKRKKELENPFKKEEKINKQ